MTETVISQMAPRRVVQSTSNLYWTFNGGYLEDPVAQVVRTSKTSVPGQEIVLHSEDQVGVPAIPTFGALTYAQIGADFFAYFVANLNGTSQIKQVPLAGGTAEIVVASPAPIGAGDLVTDGKHLCWADSQGIRSVPIGGTTVSTLATGTNFARLAIDNGGLYFASGQSVMQVPAAGGTPTTVATGIADVTALYVEPAPELLAPEVSGSGQLPPLFWPANIYWGQADGEVFAIASGRLVCFAALGTGRGAITSICPSPAGLVWADEAANRFGASVRLAAAGTVTVLYSDASEDPIADVLADDRNAYFGGATGFPSLVKCPL